MKPRGARVGGTSWVTKGTFADNLRRLSREVSDMEVVLFDLPGASNIPPAAEVRKLRALCRELRMSCTVHFPSELSADGTKEMLDRSVDNCLRIIELFSPLEPFAWILHVAGDKGSGGWLEKSELGLHKIAAALPKRNRLCVENIDYDIIGLEHILGALDVSVCLDIGHLINLGMPVMRQVEKYFRRTRVVHLHGVKPDGTDHVDLSYFDKTLLREILEKYMRDEGERVITMEVFEQDYCLSVEVLGTLCGGGWIR